MHSPCPSASPEDVALADCRSAGSRSAKHACHEKRSKGIGLKERDISHHCQKKTESQAEPSVSSVGDSSHQWAGGSFGKRQRRGKQTRKERVEMISAGEIGNERVKQSQ